MKIKAGPSLKRRTATTYKKELSYGIITGVLSGIIYSFLPDIIMAIKRKQYQEGEE